MLVDCYPSEDVFARVPQMAQRIDPVLKELDQLLEDDALYGQVRADFGKRFRYSLVHGRHSTPVEVLLRLLIVKQLPMTPRSSVGRTPCNPKRCTRSMIV